MTSVQSITSVLQRTPGLKASAIANELGVERRDVNRILYYETDRFTKALDDTWTLAEAPKQPVHSQPHHRPGPFGPAKELIPKGQTLEYISYDTPCHIALGDMASKNFSTMPVRNAEGHIIGVFTWERFASRVAGLAKSDLGIKTLCEQTVEDCMERAEFLDPDRYIDTSVDWSNVEYVIVGTEEEPLGILTVSDVWGKLNDFAEAYVLLHEIEHDLRQLITCVAGPQLADWVGNTRASHGSTPPTSLEDFTFAQYSLLICEKQERWPRFEPVLSQPRELFIHEFNVINELRNEVMHFRSRVTVQRCDQLRSFRDRTRKAVQRAAT